MPNYTPGPWSLDANDVRDNAQSVLSDLTGEVVADCLLQARGGECEANARIIAAAPTMFLACEAAKEAISDMDESKLVNVLGELQRISAVVRGS